MTLAASVTLEIPKAAHKELRLGTGYQCGVESQGLAESGTFWKDARKFSNSLRKRLVSSP